MSRRSVLLLAAAVAIAALLVIAVAAGIVYFAFSQQADRVDRLAERQSAQAANVKRVEAENRQLETEHAEIGSQIAHANLGGGAPAASVVRNLPPRLASVAVFLRAGFLAPRALPKSLQRPKSIAAYHGGYSVTWSGVSLFASRSRAEPLRVLMLGRRRTHVTLGKNRVTRVAGRPMIYAWTTKRRAYTVLAIPRLDAAARQLVASMR